MYLGGQCYKRSVIVYYDASVVLDNSMRMEISSRWKLRLMSAQVVSCCVKKLENYADKFVSQLRPI